MPASRMNEVTCDVCENGKLKAYQLNLEEAIFLCTNEECLGHLNKQDFTDYIVKRKLSDIDRELEPPRKKQKTKEIVPSENGNAFDDDLDQFLAQHNVLDPSYDISDIFNNTDNTLQETVDNFVNSEKEVRNVDKNYFDTFDSLSLSSSNEDTGKEILDPNLPIADFPSAFDQMKSNKLGQPQMKNNLRIQTSAPHQKSLDYVTRSIHSMQVAVAKENKTPKIPEIGTNNTDTKYNFLEACMSLLLHNQHISNLKLGRAALMKKLQEFYKKKFGKGYVKNLESLIGSIRRDFLAVLHRKTSGWKPDQTLPVHALPVFLKLHAPVKDLFLCTYRWEVSCTVCSKKSSAVEDNILLVLENVPEDFTMTKACCFAPCSHCGSTNQIKIFLYYVLPKAVAVHFNRGLPHRDISTLDFFHGNHAYKVTEVIQQDEENRFFTWTRNLDDESWARHDSVESQPLAGYSSLDLKASEYHIVLWERQEQGRDHAENQSIVVKSPQNASRSLSNSPNPKTLTSPFELDKLKAQKFDKTRVDKRNEFLPKYNTPISWPKYETSKANLRDSVISPVFHNQDNSVDLSIPSPSSSDVSNASDGDVTVVSSLFRAPIKIMQTVNKSPPKGQTYQWKEENLNAHQRKWTEWKFHAQNPQKKIQKPKGSMGNIRTRRVKETCRDAITETSSCSEPVKAKNLLDGVEIFFK